MLVDLLLLINTSAYLVRYVTKLLSIFGLETFLDFFPAPNHRLVEFFLYNGTVSFSTWGPFHFLRLVPGRSSLETSKRNMWMSRFAIWCCVCFAFCTSIAAILLQIGSFFFPLHPHYSHHYYGLDDSKNVEMPPIVFATNCELLYDYEKVESYQNGKS